MTMTLEPNISSTHKEAVFERKRTERDTGITQLVNAELDDGKVLDRLLATILWDTSHAPMTTNLKQLAEIGVHPPALEGLSDADITSTLNLVIDGLAELGIFLASTDHLDDRRLYSQLLNCVLVEEVRDIPPTEEMSEYIDMSFVPSTEGDAPALDAESKDPKIVNRDASLPKPKRINDEH